MPYEPVLSHIASLWPQLIRENKSDSGTLIGLPKPYVVPCASGQNGMFQEMYYWDSFFISLGLHDTPHAGLIVDMADNMAALIERFGMIPNGSRYYFLSRSQPPLFVHQVLEAAMVKRARGDTDLGAWTKRMLDMAEREHRTVWLGKAQPHHRLVYRGLSRYFDINYLDILASCESGWDHSTRCDDAWLDHLPVDLNSILYAREAAMAGLAEALGQPERQTLWTAMAESRMARLNECMWDEAAGFFFDYNWREQRRNPHPSLAGFFPLWAGWATAEQARRVVSEWLPRFLQPGGLVTTLQSAPDKQWAWPNGWAPLQWIVAAGLDSYGFAIEAAEVRRRWVQRCASVFEQTGALWEKYNVVDIDASANTSVEAGVYGQLQGFGWTNGVFVDFCSQGF